MQLYGTPTSPYTRIARIAATEFGFSLEFREMRWRTSPAELFELNPVGRVPLLVDGTRSIADSRLIWGYLQARVGSTPSASLRLLGSERRWHEETLVSQIYGVLESLMVLRGMAEEPPVTDHPYLARSRERIDLCLAALDRVAAQGYLVEPDRFGLAEAALIAATDVLRGYRIAEVDVFENIGTVCRRFVDRPSVDKTRPEF